MPLESQRLVDLLNPQDEHEEVALRKIAYLLYREEHYDFLCNMIERNLARGDLAVLRRKMKPF